MNVKLVMFKQDGQRRDFELKKETATLGRNTDCDFQIPLANVSRRHTQLMVKGEKLFVRDLGSSNGTFVNNKRVQEAELNAGDTLVLGPVIFTIVIDGQPDEIKPVRTIVEAGAAVAAKEPKGDSGTVDVEATDDAEHVELEENENEASGSGSPLSELEALSKKKKP
jgi:pSer/pThr/pTyr-binding forkhead associated (FHA) protein